MNYDILEFSRKTKFQIEKFQNHKCEWIRGCKSEGEGVTMWSYLYLFEFAIFSFSTFLFWTLFKRIQLVVIVDDYILIVGFFCRHNILPVLQACFQHSTFDIYISRRLSSRHFDISPSWIYIQWYQIKENICRRKKVQISTFFSKLENEYYTSLEFIFIVLVYRNDYSIVTYKRPSTKDHKIKIGLKPRSMPDIRSIVEV